jgi:hypothetical protein
MAASDLFRARSPSATYPVLRYDDFIGHADLPHTYSYVPDIAAGLVAAVAATVAWYRTRA